MPISGWVEGGISLSAAYILTCMVKKLLRNRRIGLFLLAGLLMAGVGVQIVAGAARQRELGEPWYMPRTADIRLEGPADPQELYAALHEEFEKGTVNGYALIADADPSGGISLGGLEGNLWYPLEPEDRRFSTGENLFWAALQAVPQDYFYRVDQMTATVNQLSLRCAGLSYYGLNWDWSQGGEAHSVAVTLNGRRPENIYLDDEARRDFMTISPLLTSAAWMADNRIPVLGASVTLTQPNDMATLERIVRRLSAPCALSTALWSAGRIGALTANEWVYLGALILVFLTIASLFYGLLDSYQQEFFIYRKVGASKGAVGLACAILVTGLATLTYGLAHGVFLLILRGQGESPWISPLPGAYNAALYLAFAGLCLGLSLNHLRGMGKKFRRIGANL